MTVSRTGPRKSSPTLQDSMTVFVRSAVQGSRLILGLTIFGCGNVAFMGTLPTPNQGIDPGTVTVRPTWGAEERRRRDELVASRHCLPFPGLFGKGLRHVAAPGPTWLAPIGWQATAFKLAARPLDRLERGVAVSALAPYRPTGALRDSDAASGGESGLAGAGSQPAAPVREHAGGSRSSGLCRGNSCRHRALRRNRLSGVELALAGPDPRQCQRAEPHRCGEGGTK